MKRSLVRLVGSWGAATAQPSARGGRATGDEAGADEIMTIAMGFDGIYAPHVAAVLASVVAHAPGARFRFVMLHAEVPEATKRELEAVAAGSEFVWREVGDDDLPAFENCFHLTRATLFRLGLEKLAPADCRRVIYLDVDLVVTGDIRGLWRSDLAGALVGAVKDDTIDADAFAAKWGLASGPGYFNAGVLVIDLERVREGRVFSRATEFHAANAPRLPFFDQDALNWACWGRWRALDLAWNVQRTTAIDHVLGAHDLGGKRPCIVHYTGPDKPWLAAGYHPWPWLYWEALARTTMFDAVAAKGGFGVVRLAQLWLRWLRKKPRIAAVDARPHGASEFRERPVGGLSLEAR